MKVVVRVALVAILAGVSACGGDAGPSSPVLTPATPPVSPGVTPSRTSLPTSVVSASPTAPPTATTTDSATAVATMTSTPTPTPMRTAPPTLSPTRTQSRTPLPTGGPQQAYVANEDSGTVSVIDVSSHQVVQTFVPGIAHAIRALAATGAGDLIVRSEGQVAIVEAETNGVRAAIELPGSGGIAVANGTRVYVGAEDLIRILDAGTGKLVSSIAAGGVVGALSVDHRGATLYISTADGIRSIDVATGALESAIVGAARAFAIAPDDQTVLAVDGGRLRVFDRAMHTVTSRTLYNGELGQPAFSLDGSVAYVPLIGWGYFVVDAATGAEVERVSMPSIGGNFVLTSDGLCAFSASYEGVSMVDLAAREVVRRFDIPAYQYTTDLVLVDDGRTAYAAPCLRGVCRIDTITGEVSEPIWGSGLPRRIAASANGERVVVTAAIGPPSVIDPSGERSIAPLVDGSFADFPPDSDGVAVTHDGRRAYVVHGRNFGFGHLSAVDLATLDELWLQETFSSFPADAVSLSPDESVVYVSSANTDSVYAVDAEDGRLRSTLAVGGGPDDIAFDPVRPRAYVLRKRAGDVAVIDVAASQVLNTISFPVAGFDPGLAAVDTARDRIFALRGQEVVRFDLRTGTTTTVVELDEPGSGIAVSPAGETLYVISGRDYDYQGALYVVDVASSKVDEIPLLDGGPRFIALTPNGKQLVMTMSPRFESIRGSVRIVDTVTLEQRSIDVGRSTPERLWITPDGARAYVAGCGEGTCTIDLGDSSVSGGLGWFTTSIAFSPTTSRAYTTSPPYSPEANAIFEVDLETGAVLSTIDLPARAHSLLLTADGATLLADLGNRVVAIDTGTGEVAMTIAHAQGADVRLEQSQDADEILLLGAPADGVSVLDLEAGAIAAYFPASFAPASIAVHPNGASAYIVGNSAGGLIWELDLERSEVEDPILAGTELAGAALTSDGRTLYVVDSANDRVLAIDTESHATVAAIAVGRGPRAIAIALAPTAATTPTASATGTTPTSTQTATRTRRTQTPTRTATHSGFTPVPTRTPTPLCGETCDGRACGFVLCPDGFTFSPATCSAPLDNACGCAAIACATPTVTATPTLPSPPQETCGPAAPRFSGPLCGTGDTTCEVIESERLPLVDGGVGGFALDRADRPHLLYTSNVYGFHPIYVTRGDDGRWSSSESPFGGFTGSLTLALDGTAYTLMQNYDDSGQRLWSYANGAWAQLEMVPNGTRLDPSLVVDDAGCLHAAAELFFPATDGYARWRDGNWVIGAVGSPGRDGFERTLALSPQGAPYMFFREFGGPAVGLRFAPVHGVSESVSLPTASSAGPYFTLVVTQDEHGSDVAHLLQRSQTLESATTYGQEVSYGRRSAEGTWAFSALAKGTVRSNTPCPEPPEYPTDQTCVEEYVEVAPAGMVSNGRDVWILFSRQMIRDVRPLSCRGPICDWDYPRRTRVSAELVLLAPDGDGFRPALVLPGVDGGLPTIDSRGRIHVLVWDADGLGRHLQIQGGG